MIRESSPARRVDVDAAAFRLENVSYSYAGEVIALDRVSLTISAGEKVAILGANGCGKSTLIKMMDGLVFPQAGVLHVFGDEVTEETLRIDAVSHRFRRRVGFIFQNADAQLFSSTVREEIAFGPLQMGLPAAEIEKRIEDLSNLLGIAGLLDRAPFHLSGGEKKKVAIASSLATNPEVLLLDEPTGGLDPRSQAELVELLVRLHGAGKTLVTATHDLAVVPRIADRVLVFSEDHRLAASGAATDILRDLDLLLRVNLIHSQTHRHGDILHSHPHPPGRAHIHDERLAGAPAEPAPDHVHVHGRDHIHEP